MALGFNEGEFFFEVELPAVDSDRNQITLPDSLRYYQSLVCIVGKEWSHSSRIAGGCNVASRKINGRIAFDAVDFNRYIRCGK